MHPKNHDPVKFCWNRFLHLVGISDYHQRCAKYIILHYLGAAFVIYLAISPDVTGTFEKVVWWLSIPVIVILATKPTDFIVRGCIDCCGCRKPKHRREVRRIDPNVPNLCVCHTCDITSEENRKFIERAQKKIDEASHEAAKVGALMESSDDSARLSGRTLPSHPESQVPYALVGVGGSDLALMDLRSRLPYNVR